MENDNNKVYDSTLDTTRHIRAVSAGIFEIITNLANRAFAHDASKLQPPEKEAFDRATPKLRSLTYGSPEYLESLKELQGALDHHYAVNDHHPQYFVNGINGMSLMSLTELISDWNSAGKRHADGSMAKSLVINQSRFNISDQLQEILENTAIELKWTTRQEIDAAKKEKGKL